MTNGRDRSLDTVEEAAAQWVVRLSDGTPALALRKDFEAWLGEDARHPETFERLHAVWGRAGEAGRRWRDRRRTIQVGAVLAVAVALLPLRLVFQDPAYQTGKGEQELVRLDDGTEVTLNTDSRVVVDYERDLRTVRLTRGEAYFDVAHNPRRPFIVEVDHDEVRVLGTSFLVRRDGGMAQVALVSGSVMVTPGGAAALNTPPVTLAPGERVRWREGSLARIDRPRLDNFLAWRRGELVLEQMPVTEAVKEMNRYSRTPVVLEDASVGRARISGVFKTGDADAFAQTIARLYGLTVERQQGKMVLTRRG